MLADIVAIKVRLPIVIAEPHMNMVASDIYTIDDLYMFKLMDKSVLPDKILLSGFSDLNPEPIEPVGERLYADSGQFSTLSLRQLLDDVMLVNPCFVTERVFGLIIVDLWFTEAPFLDTVADRLTRQTYCDRYSLDGVLQ